MDQSFGISSSQRSKYDHILFLFVFSLGECAADLRQMVWESQPNVHIIIQNLILSLRVL